jgi:TolA protein
MAPPRRPPELQSDRDYSTGLKWSLGLHLGFAVFLIIKSLVFPSAATPYVPTLRVDIVGLPDILKKDLNNIPSTKEITDIVKKAEDEAKNIKPQKLPPMPKKEVAEPDEMVMKPKLQSPEKTEKDRDKRLRAAMDRMKALAKLGGDERKSAPLIKGNKISKGESLSGEARESDQSNYYDSVLTQVRGNWALPVWLSRQSLSAQVQIYIDAKGRLHGIRFVKLSGNPQFDDAVKHALEESQPFPAPPRELAANMLVNGITFGFPL